MNLAIIADDLTGANDSGVQLAKYGLQTSVFFKMDKGNVQSNEAIVFDTDSRAMAPAEAKKLVAKVTRFLLDEGINNIYKKIDSTMRGSIGAELAGMQQELQADFIFIAPGYPSNNRKVIDGYHYLNGKLLGETEISLDPVTPVAESYLPALLESQIGEETGLISLAELRSSEKFIQKLNVLKEQGITYIIVDSEKEEDLQLFLSEVKKLSAAAGLVGSAGLANYLPAYFGLEAKEQTYQIVNQNKPILTVVGSVNVNSRNQLNKLLADKSAYAIEIDSYKAVSSLGERKEEEQRVYNEVKKQVASGHDIVLYSSGERDDIDYARKIGESNGYNFTETSREIVKMIGAVAAQLLKEGIFQGIIMTGGDTAKKICEHWDITGFTLYDELEAGVPISSFIGIENLFAITKAGGFGQDNVLIDASKKLRGE
ncbi:MULTISPECIES: four-carbon acid sugar kinase family protein [Oceanobacillus]|uniref:four-carbon acid sugar kinase family protein n=1 Tax=Oceanobacillus TaxID=182709 RepID=UPI0030D76BC6